MVFDPRTGRTHLLNAHGVTAQLINRGRHFHLVPTSTIPDPSPCALNPVPSSSKLPDGVSFVLRPPHVAREECARLNEAVHLEWLKGRGASWDSGCPEVRFCRKHGSFQICVTDLGCTATNQALVTESGLAAALDTLEGAALDACVSRHLTEGGDDRLHLNDDGVNRYHCPPRPVPASVVVRGSCTCSSPTPDGFDAARATLRTLWSGQRGFADLMQDTARRLSRALALQTPHEVILHPSGSDAELIPLAVAAASAEEMGCAAIVNIVAAAGEVGSGTAAASGGRHFSEFVPTGRSVANNAVVDGFPVATTVVEIKPRDPAGARIDTYDDLVRSACMKALQEIGDPFIVLHAVDGSKTGMRIPSKGLLLEMQAKLGRRMLIVMDACQCRSSTEEIDWFLQSGAVVLITASKFYSAPGFCGAVLVPKHAAAILNEWDRMPSGMSDYLTRYEVPMSMYAMRRRMHQGSMNVGLLLRWSAGLAEMELFKELGGARSVRHPRVGRRRKEARRRAVPTARPHGRALPRRARRRDAPRRRQLRCLCQVPRALRHAPRRHGHTAQAAPAAHHRRVGKATDEGIRERP